MADRKLSINLVDSVLPAPLSPLIIIIIKVIDLYILMTTTTCLIPTHTPHIATDKDNNNY